MKFAPGPTHATMSPPAGVWFSHRVASLRYRSSADKLRAGCPGQRRLVRTRANDVVPVVKAQLLAMQDRTTVIRAGRLIDGTTASGVRRDLAIFVDSGTITRV